MGCRLIPEGVGRGSGAARLQGSRVFSESSLSQDNPAPHNAEGSDAGEQNYEGDEDLTEDERKAKADDERKEKVAAQLIEGADRALDRWNQNQTQEVREASIASYIETGEIDHAAAGIDELEASIVQAAAAVQVERQVLKPVGLSMDQWLEHIDDAELPAFRRAVVEGNWQALIDHARAAAKMRLDLGI